MYPLNGLPLLSPLATTQRVVLPSSPFSELESAKYQIRGILMHLGMDVIAGNLRIPLTPLPGLITTWNQLSLYAICPLSWSDGNQKTYL